MKICNIQYFTKINFLINVLNYLICYMTYPIINSIILYILTHPKYGWFSKLSYITVLC